MDVLITIFICAVVGYLGFVAGEYSGTNKYHKYLLKEGKIHEKQGE